MIETTYEIVHHPRTQHRVFGVGMLDAHGRLWQFWGSPSHSNINIIEGDAEKTDYAPARGRDFAINLRAREIDPDMITAATVRQLARAWIKRRNKDIKDGTITD